MAYFLAHPEAADSLEGVASWRLPDEAIRRRVADTREALEWLVAKGFLLATSRASSGRIFSLNGGSLPEAKRFTGIDPEAGSG